MATQSPMEAGRHQPPAQHRLHRLPIELVLQITDRMTATDIYNLLVCGDLPREIAENVCLISDSPSANDQTPRPTPTATAFPEIQWRVPFPHFSEEVMLGIASPTEEMIRHIVVHGQKSKPVIVIVEISGASIEKTKTLSIIAKSHIFKIHYALINSRCYDDIEDPVQDALEIAPHWRDCLSVVLVNYYHIDWKGSYTMNNKTTPTICLDNTRVISINGRDLYKRASNLKLPENSKSALFNTLKRLRRPVDMTITGMRPSYLIENFDQMPMCDQVKRLDLKVNSSESPLVSISKMGDVFTGVETLELTGELDRATLKKMKKSTKTFYSTAMIENCGFSANLLSIKISIDGFEGIYGLFTPGLESAEIITETTSVSLKGWKAPRLKKLSITANCITSFDRCLFPNVLDLNLDLLKPIALESCHVLSELLPKLESLGVYVTRSSESINHSIIQLAQKVKQLKVKGEVTSAKEATKILSLFRGVTFESVEHLQIDTVIPILKKTKWHRLSRRPDGVVFLDECLAGFINLRQATLTVEFGTSCEFPHFERFPKLVDLVIHAPSDSISHITQQNSKKQSGKNTIYITDRTFNNLKRLWIFLGADQAVMITSTHFPKLSTFHIESVPPTEARNWKMNELDDSLISFFDYSSQRPLAPNLVHFSAQNLVSAELDLTGCSRLKRIIITGGVNELIMGPQPSLTAFTLSVSSIGRQPFVNLDSLGKVSFLNVTTLQKNLQEMILRRCPPLLRSRRLEDGLYGTRGEGDDIPTATLVQELMKSAVIPDEDAESSN